jgi:hypothetical protein
MTGPRIYKAINAITAEFAKIGIAKSHTNFQEQYQYRSIDDVLNRMAPLLAKHRLCLLPRVLERIAIDRSGARDEMLVSVALRVAFDLVSAVDQSRHTVEAYGEALDGGDKATSKAMSAAYKTAMLQTFCIPVPGNEDADAQTHKLRKWVHGPEPIQGWEQWSNDILEIISSCETEEALGRVQNSNRSSLKALSRERPDLYAGIGGAFANQRSSFGSPAAVGLGLPGPDKLNGKAARKAPPSVEAETALA